MKNAAKAHYRRALLVFTVLLLIFAFVADGILISRQRADMLREAEAQTERELKLAATLIREAMLKRNYQTVEQFLRQWADEDPAILTLKATAPNGFVLMDFRRDRATRDTAHVSGPVQFSGRKLLEIELTRDLEWIERNLNTLRVQLIVGSLIFVGILAVLLWLTIRRIALVPMQWIEGEQEKARYRLERLAKEKDSELAATTTRLEQAIALREQVEHLSARRAARLSVLHDLEQQILSASSLRDVAESAVRHVRRLMVCRTAAVTVFNEDGEKAVVLASNAEEGGEVHPGTELIVRSIPGIDALRSGEFHRVDDLRGLEGRSALDDQLVQHGVRAYVAIPLLARDQLLGTLHLGSASNDACTAEDLDAASEIADILAISVQNDIDARAAQSPSRPSPAKGRREQATSAVTRIRNQT